MGADWKLIECGFVVPRKLSLLIWAAGLMLRRHSANPVLDPIELHQEHGEESARRRPNWASAPVYFSVI
jgi:hypothetical protein